LKAIIEKHQKWLNDNDSECFAKLLDRAERMAKIRGWKTEVE
jgi:hypothetical protein